MRIRDGAFIFTHNGEDFTEEHFASLCRFGYSNKRTLHTIGFRGIGFKSTFSLGDTVELYTPTLSVAFNRRRFTEPVWVNSGRSDDGITQVRVSIKNQQRHRQVDRNLQDWLNSPVSLLFFKHIRCLRIGDQELQWDSAGPGPVAETEWMALRTVPDQAFLLAQSGPEPFPADALSEIRQERLQSIDEDADLPPCKVEIVLGAKGRLYVVLPTGVETELPFACNAPFIQDPGRLKIKDVETSPTNKWLLERAGNLAATVMLQWLKQTDTSVAERSRAYGFFPDVDRNETSLEGTCAATVEIAFDNRLEGEAFLLTGTGDLKPAKGSLILPEQILDVWPEEQVSALLDDAGRPAFSRYVAAGDRKRLVHWGVLEEVGRDHVILVLQTKHLPRPNSWRGLLALWAYVAPDITGYRHRVPNSRQVRIVPVQGKEVLRAADEVVRLGEKRLLQSDADWDFLAAHLLVLNQNWPRFLAQQRKEAEERKDGVLQDDVAAAYAILGAVGLEETSDASAVIERVALDFYGRGSISLSECVHLAQIAGKLGANAGEAFRFYTRDLVLRPVKQIILFDSDGTLPALFPGSWCSAHLLHQEYSKSFSSCTHDEWVRWISSGRSGLLSFAPLVSVNSYFRGRPQIEAELRRRGWTGTVYCPYVTANFYIEDWDFEAVLWSHWNTLAANDANLWGRVVELILAQPDTCWSKAKSAKPVQVATTGNRRAIIDSSIIPAWIMKLRDLPCLPDTRGFYHKPSDLLRRTPETQALIEVEPFLHSRLDTEATRPLLNLLGVRSTPTSPDRLLDCLRALAKTDKPPVHEVDKWYRRLDQMIETCSTADFVKIRKAFDEENIVLSQSVGWTRASGVFVSSDEDDVPGAAVVRESVKDLTLWHKIGIPERPTVDLAIQWLKELPSGQGLSQDEARRVRALLKRHSIRIWHECAHWLNLAGQWVPVSTLCYALSMQTLIPWGHLHEWVKQKTADFQGLPIQITDAPPFSDIPALGARIEERFNRRPLSPGMPDRKAWLTQVGLDLSRIELADQSETVRIRGLAARAAATVWQTAPRLEIVPYIDGIPAGTPRPTEVVWLDKVLYVEALPKAKVARVVPDRLGKVFERPDISAALNYCFGRSPAEVTEYLEENFKLTPREAKLTTAVEGTLPNDGAPQCGTAAPASTVGTPPAGSQGEKSDDGAVGVTLNPGVEPEPTDVDEPGSGETASPGKVPGKPPAPTKPPKPSIIERFARSQGFQKDGEERFFHTDGSWIARVSGDRFPWERRSATGGVIRRYYLRDHCLETAPLQIEADIWRLVESHPEVYALVLSNQQGDPVEVPGTRLVAMRNGHQLTLYPATYRLVYEGEDE